MLYFAPCYYRKSTSGPRLLDAVQKYFSRRVLSAIFLLHIANQLRTRDFWTLSKSTFEEGPRCYLLLHIADRGSAYQIRKYFSSRVPQVKFLLHIAGRLGEGLERVGKGWRESVEEGWKRVGPRPKVLYKSGHHCYLLLHVAYFTSQVVTVSFCYVSRTPRIYSQILELHYRYKATPKIELMSYISMLHIATSQTVSRFSKFRASL
jgi:hypothetical protein